MKAKSISKSLIRTAILFITALLIKLISLNSNFIETYYSTGIYFYISSFLRLITGWLPFSLGDILYVLTTTYILIKCIKNIRALFKKRVTKKSFLSGVIKIVRALLWIYIVFNLFWGLNYNRLGIAYQLQIEPAKYSTEELKTLTQSLLQKVNTARLSLGDSSYQYPNNEIIFDKAKQAYSVVEKKYSFLAYRQPCIKKTLFGKLWSYIGAQGYYNPFTGESQVNTTIPSFKIPYTTTHEMAHQLGYADEDEANFVGYLAAKYSGDNIFSYSVYFDLFNYANRDLFFRDSAAAHANYRALDTLVKRDEIAYRKFWLKYKNPFDPYITALYSNFLKMNNQPNGMKTYSEVIEWLIAYQKKYRQL